MNKSTVILSLGSFNDNNKNLSLIAKYRMKKCYELLEKYKSNNNVKIILSGGKGSHFNITDETHSSICEKYLIEKLNVNKIHLTNNNIKSFKNITNTVEEAIAFYEEMIKEKSVFFLANTIIILTSPFHLERTKYLFKKVYDKISIKNKGILLFESCDILPISNKNDNNIDFLDPYIPKKNHKDLWKYYMSNFSKNQINALKLYEKNGLDNLINRPYGIWLDFLNKI